MRGGHDAGVARPRGIPGSAHAAPHPQSIVNVSAPPPLIAAVCLFVVVAWASALVVLMRRQARVIFGSPRALRSAPAGAHAVHGAQPVALAVADGVRLQGWLTTSPQPASGLVVWLGGRNEDVGWTPAIASWLGPDWAVCAFNYRGCAGSTGAPGEADSVRDALAIAAWGVARTGVPHDRVILIGRSLGSAVAVQVAARRPVAGLVLLSPPASVRRIMRRNPLLWPALPWLRHPFDSLAAAAEVRCPSLVLLAERDRRVPHGESQALARALRGAMPAAPAMDCLVRTMSGTTHRTLARSAGSLAAMAAFAHGLAARWQDEHRSVVPRASQDGESRCA
jgi:pimeloyl-ACP methyl ester carboxylesterase